ncbi:MAG TPA: NAD(P)/FAD-dependent oxidoreductase [Actinomycetota bacterium]|nr:NAD(P)/FAD-dependent oxidoreductase [Actinomycetota bacterium]
MEDVVVCGGGAAGLAAAVWLGRYRRKVLVVDGGRQRNLTAGASHGYLTRDGVAPAELLAAARDDASAYETVSFLEGEANAAERAGDGFVIGTERGPVDTVRVILATGVRDEFPDIPGFNQLYGTYIFHCSCCDGYETSGLEVLAIGWGEHVAGYALDLLEWGATVRVVTNGNTFEGDQACRDAMARHDIDLIEETVEEFYLQDGAMTGVRLKSGRELPAERAFFSIAHHPRNELARELGCAIDELGYVKVGPHGETSVEGVYAAGDLTPGEQLVQVAASEGAIAGIACALSLRGAMTPSAAPDPGPDPQAELHR